MSEPDRPRTTRRRFLAGVAAGAAGAAVAYRALRNNPIPQPTPGGTDVTAEPNPRLFSFVGGPTGAWRVTLIKPYLGEPLPSVERLDMVNRNVLTHPAGAGAGWVLRGVTSNERYATRPEKTELAAKQVGLGRPTATHAALIPIRKNAAWWALTQDERRAVFEDTSHHVRTGLRYLPAVARRLHHCRDLGEAEPFDFVTLFDYAGADAPAFEQMVAELRASEEWKYVEREVDVRLVRDGG